MERYQSGVEFVSPRYRGEGSYFFAAMAPYLDREKADYPKAEPPAEDEEPSDLDEILGTCTFKNAEDMKPREDGFKPFYIDTIQEEKVYMWRRIYPLEEKDERTRPLPREMADSILMDERNWAEA
jgi:hypothetical protein